MQNDLKEARKKIDNLKIISKKYLSNIDSLLVINKKLTSEKDSIISVNKDINWKNYKLNQQNKQLSEKVSKGSVLELFDLEISPIRFRTTGREISTKFAKKVQKYKDKKKVRLHLMVQKVSYLTIKKEYYISLQKGII